MAYVKKMNLEQPVAAGTEVGRRPTGVPAATGAASAPDIASTARNGHAVHPDPQVVEKAVRRTFTKAYKLDILKQADACKGTGQIGALLRREGLYSSHLSNWRWLHSKGLIDGSASRKHAGRSPAQDPRVPQLQRENARLKARLQQAELILEIQKKASEILGIPLRTFDNEGND